MLTVALVGDSHLANIHTGQRQELEKLADDAVVNSARAPAGTSVHPVAGAKRNALAPAPHVVLMCGVAGAGKTTYALKLEREGFVRLSIDEEMWLRHGPVSLRSKDWESLASVIRAELRARLIALIEDNRRVVVDFSFWQRSTREDYKTLVENLGATWELVYLKATPTVLRERLRERSHAAGANSVDVDPGTLERYLSGFEEPAGEGEIVIVQS